MTIIKGESSSFFRKYSKLERKDFLFCYLLVLIPVVQFLIFWVYVNFDNILLAFREDWTGAFTFRHFEEVWAGIIGKDVYGFNLLELIGKSVLLWCLSNLIVFPISIATTYVLYRRVWGHYAFRVIYTIPSLVGGVIWVGLTKIVCEWNGPIISALSSMGVHFDYAASTQGLFGSYSTAFPTIFILSFVLGIAGGNVIITGAFSRTPADLIDAGKLDGLGFWGTFWHIELPCAWPTISTLMTVSLCSIFVADSNFFLYSNGTGAYGLANMGYYLYSLTFRISQSTALVRPYGYPAAIGICVTLISVPVVLLGRKLLDKIMETVEI